ncbi:hypothetical protein ECLG_04950 [Escherichia coli TA271]|nr:hypothetical protein ECLG_04950 [Escherichia coli TA271]
MITVTEQLYYTEPTTAIINTYLWGIKAWHKGSN